MTKFQSILGYLLIIGIWCTAMQLGYKYYYTPDYEEAMADLEKYKQSGKIIDYETLDS